MGDISVDLFLETLKQLLTTSNLDFTAEEKSQLQSLEEEIKDLRGFLKFAEKRRYKHPEVMNLVVQIRDVVSEADNALELFIVVVSKGDHASNSLREHKDHLFLVLERVEKDIKNLEAEVKQNYDKMGSTIFVYLHLFQETFEELLMTSYLNFTEEEYNQLRSLEKEIKNLGGPLNNVEKKWNKHSEVMNLVMQIKDMVSEAEKAVKLFIADASKDHHASNSLRKCKDQLFLELERVIKDIKNLQVEVRQICNEILLPISGAAVRSLEHSSTGSRGGSASLGGSNPPDVVEESIVVGFEEEEAKLLVRLFVTRRGSFEIIPIIGPGGCGKTTLARKVYDHPLTSRLFEVRAWVVVSQDYNRTMKRDLLIDIFKSVFPENHTDYEESNEDDLGKTLYHFLKGKTYLFVMDNVWGVEAWHDIQISFPPGDFNGNKVLFTSRLRLEACEMYSSYIARYVTAYEDKSSRPRFVEDLYDEDVGRFSKRVYSGYSPHYVEPLSKSCSWELLEVKVFGKKRCPSELVEMGKQIATKCEGLPLAIVTIAGILATDEQKLSVWQQIAKRVSSIIAKKQEGCMELLELSYNHLPLHLKACFLYIGAHPKDYEISSRELTWLWIAEGFIQQDKEGKSLENLAEDYFLNLLKRNLIMIARRSFIGKIKTYRIHDLLRELCLRKAEEENFFMQINGDDSSTPTAINKHRRLFISRQFFDKFFFSRVYPQNIRTFLCLGSRHSRIELCLSFFVETFKLLRVFSFVADECRGEILRGQLVQLRYLAVQLSQKVDFPIPFHLVNLETLTVQNSCLKDIKLSSQIFKMVRLRHLYSKHGRFTYHVHDDEDEGNMLDSLKTLHQMCICEHCLRFLERTPNLRKLGLTGDLYRKGDDDLMFSDLESLIKCLEIPHVESVRISSIGLRLPPTLTQLSLKHTNLKWQQLSILLQKLPSLEVLKLLTGACSGPVWDTTKLEEGFSALKYLKLDSLDIEEWKAFKGQFCGLEILVIRHCKEMKGIPFDFAYQLNFRKINVEYSNQSLEQSAKEIQEEKRYICGDDYYPLNLVCRHNDRVLIGSSGL